MKQSGGLFQPKPRNLEAKFSGTIIVGAKHIHGNDFHATSHLSRITKKMIANGHLSPPIQDSYDLSGIKILCNEAHLHLPIETVTPLTVSTSQDIISGSRLKSCLK